MTDAELFEPTALDVLDLSLGEGMRRAGGACPLCRRTGNLITFFERAGLPTNSCLLVASRDEAERFPRGSMALTFCACCGFVFNAAFETGKAIYDERYEETQLFSPTFVDFGRQLAKRWVKDFDLDGRRVLEIGCGKGEFLVWMVESGAAEGIGIDPGVHPERIDGALHDRIRWIADFYSERYTDLAADAIVCRHTLEHISPVHEFVSLIHRSLDGRRGVPVLFELPDVVRVLEEGAFWDVYYEHCSYFSLGSLARLFRSAGFDVTGLEVEYDDQYLVLESRSSDGTGTLAPELTSRTTDVGRTWAAVQHFGRTVARLEDEWMTRLRTCRDRGGKAVIWGGGSKGVSFLTTIGAGDLVTAAVDINPHKHGKFMAGSGHPVVAPADLRQIDPELVIVMNPIYLKEIRAEIASLGLSPAEIAAI